MRKFINNLFLLGGLLLTLAALPVFAQEDSQNQINKKPLQDFGNYITDKIQKKEIDLNAPFSVELNTVLTSEGKFDVKKSKIGAKTGDAKMIEVFSEAMMAVSDSGLLKNLRNLGVEILTIKINQDDKSLSIQFISELPTSAKARTTESGMNMMISIGKQKVKESDTLALLNAVSTTNDNKNFILKFLLPKENFQEIILRNINKLDEKEQKQNAN